MLVSHNIPAELAQELVNAFCWKFNYKSVILNNEGEQIPNPESTTAFAKRMMGQIPRNILIEYRLKVFNEGIVAVKNQAENDAETITTE